MKRFPALCGICLVLPLAMRAGDDADKAHAPVAVEDEPADSMVVMLPGLPAKSAPVSVAQPKTVAGAAISSIKPYEEEDHRPILRRAPRPILPAEFQADSGFFCQKLIGAWTERDAYNLFGDPLRQRLASGDEGQVNGHIYTYSDPTGRYREIELDFARDTGLLRTVFVYPWNMSWVDCRRTWGGDVQSAQANKGRIFYSYKDRRLDVLVDTAGRVISLGLY